MIFIIGGAYQGKLAYAREMFGNTHTILADYQERVKAQLEAGLDPMEEARKIIKTKEPLVIISNEMGYGLVPIDPKERALREASGRVNIYFAKEAEAVFHVMCGIGEQIK